MIATDKPASQSQHAAAFIVAFGGFIVGTLIGWINSAKDEIMNGRKNVYPTEEEYSWVAACLTLGATISSFPVGLLLNRFRRKIILTLLMLPILLGLIMLSWGTHIWLLYLGRCFAGFGVGGICVVVPLYACEIAHKETRGTLGAYFQLHITFGTLAMYLMGFGPSIYWMLYLCVVSIFLYAVALLCVPESPIYLLKVGVEAEATQSMKWLRGNKYNAEYKEIRMTEAKIKGSKESVEQSLRRRGNLKALFIGIGLMFFQQMSGLNAIIFYSNDILELSHCGLDPKVATVIIGVIQVLATVGATLMMDRISKRFLLALSTGAMSVTTATVGLYFIIMKHKRSEIDSLTWLPFTSLCIYIAMFSIGFGPVPWLMSGELYGSDIKGIAASIGVTLNWALVFVITKTYINLKDHIGVGLTFSIYSVVAALGVIFVIYFVIETTGKSLIEIQIKLGNLVTDE